MHTRCIPTSKRVFIRHPTRVAKAFIVTRVLSNHQSIFIDTGCMLQNCFLHTNTFIVFNLNAKITLNPYIRRHPCSHQVLLTSAQQRVLAFIMIQVFYSKSIPNIRSILDSSPSPSITPRIPNPPCTDRRHRRATACRVTLRYLHSEAHTDAGHFHNGYLSNSTM